MARRADLERFARLHGLKIGTIADLIRYRLHNERSVERIFTRVVSTEFGRFQMHCYEDHVHRTVHLALVRGDLKSGTPPLVRVHLKDTLRDVIGVRAAELGWPLRDAMRRIAAEENGVVVMLRGTESPRDLVEAARSLGTDRARTPPNAPVLRTYGIGAQILQDLGVSRMRVLSAPKQMLGLSAFGLEVTEYVDEASAEAAAGAPDAA